MDLKRRRFFAASGAAALGGAGGLAWWLQRTQDYEDTQRARLQLPPDPDFPNPLALPGEDGMYAILDAPGSFTIVAKPIRHTILPGHAPQSMLAYEVEHEGRKMLNPLLRVRQGANLRVRLWNALDETSIIHWHGLKVDTNNDGHPHYAVGPGETYDYQFTVSNRAGTYWYHPHPHHLAGKQAYLGLAGFFIVEDHGEIDFQRALDLELGVTDIPLLIQDKRFGADGALRYAPDVQEHFRGYLGDRVLVNLTPSPCFDCASRLYRFRLVNGSNARIYRLAFMQGAEPLEFHVVGADGGLLKQPIAARELFLSPSERADVVLDLSLTKLGDRIVLSSLPFDAMAFATSAKAPVSTNDTVPVNGAALELMLIRVTAETNYGRALPRNLSRIEPLNTDSASHRVFTLDHAQGLWRINRASYRMTETAFSVKRGTTEVWEFRNPPPTMPHPIHIHGVQFRLLERSASPAPVRDLAIDARGISAAESGWKDSALLWPGETLKLAIDFSHPFPGDQVFMLQCHNLEHESSGMMVNFRVEQ